jgi:hypothetical protein
MRDLYSQQLQLDALNGEMESPFEAFSSGLELYASSFKGTFAELQSIGQSFSQSLGDGIADAFARSVVQGDSFKESLHSLSETILTELISSIVRMGIQWALSAALGNAAASTATIASLGLVTTAATTSLATLTVATQAAGALATAAWTPAAIAASLATAGGNAAPATAGIASTSAAGAAAIKATALAGFESGGYTGNGGIKDIAGVVHGKEFVLNASATAKNRPYLEAMNNGASFNDLAKPNPTNLNFQIINKAPGVEFQTNQLTESDVQIIAERAVAKNAPKIIAGSLSSPNSVVSKSLNNNYKVGRKR